MEYYLSQKKITKKYIYYLPKYTRLVNKNKNHPEIEYLNQIKKYVKTAAIKYNFEFIDGSTFFYNRIEPLDIFHYSLPTHLNENGYRLISNSGLHGGQEVPHLHFHIFGGEIVGKMVS